MLFSRSSRSTSYVSDRSRIFSLRYPRRVSIDMGLLVPMLQDSRLDFFGDVVGEIRALQISMERQQAVQHFDRTGHIQFARADIASRHHFEFIHRLHRIGRLVFKNETPVGRMTPALPGPDEISQIAEVDVVVTDEDASDTLRAVRRLDDLGDAPAQVVSRKLGAP